MIDHMKDLGVDWRIILKCILNGMVRFGVNYCSAGLGPVAGCCDRINIL
jgi:hypothetical protein